MQFKIFWALPFLVLFSTSNFGWIDISWLIETLQIYKMHQNTIWNYLQKMSKILWDFFAFSLSLHKIYQEGKVPSKRLFEIHFLKRIPPWPRGSYMFFSSRPFLPNWLNVSGSNMREISSVALPRVELRWNAFNLGTTHYCERRNYFKVSLCYRLILSPYHAMELLCPSFSALSSSSRNL